MDRAIDLLHEQASAQEIQRLLYYVIKQSQSYSDSHDSTINMLLQDAWDELRLKPTALSVQDLDTLSNEVNRFMIRKSLTEDIAKRSERMLKEPYFARIDFREDGHSESDVIRIGLYSLADQNGALVVHDWRAPIAGVYYDAMPGNVSYEAPGGTIAGELTLKRQYRFEDGVLSYFVDTDLAIDDDMLMDILMSATSTRMRNIVSTIQKEQNQAIRQEKQGVLTVIGGAGSGKTSVAMHRAAYLMYRQRGMLSAKSVATLSPTNAFSEYISSVLPELGEDNTRQLVMNSVYGSVIGIAPEMPMMQVEYLSIPEYQLRRDSVGYKSGLDFVALLDGYIQHFKLVGPEFSDIGIDSNILVKKTELERMYRSEFRILSPGLRLIRIQAVLQNKLKRWEQSLKGQYEENLRSKFKGSDLIMAVKLAMSQRLQPAKHQIRKLSELDPLHIYADVLKDIPSELAEAARENANSRLIWQEDAPGIAYLMLKLGFAQPDRTIRHLLVDEAQDYSMIALSFLHVYFPMAQLTLLGDPNQRTIPGMPQCVPSHWAQCFGAPNSQIVHLTKCYRSTAQITRFCNALLPDGRHVEEFGRDGATPIILANSDDALLRLIEGYKKDGMKRMAIVTRSLPEAARIHKRVKGSYLIEDDQDMMPEAGGVIVSCYHTMKGLEFDAVIVVWPDVQLDSGERRRLYTACSRALHNLALLAPSSMIKELGIVL